MDSVSVNYAPPRHVGTVDDCMFYHSIEIPNYGLIDGLSDMRPSLPILFDPVNFKGKNVIEIGPASGFFTFEMERRGANVTSIELGPDMDWDYVRHHDGLSEDVKKQWQADLERVKNSYWFGHERCSSKAKVVNGTAYDVKRLGLSAEIGLLSNTLVHLHDPLGAIASLAASVTETLILCDAEPYTGSRAGTFFRHLFRKKCVAEFIPRHDNKKNIHTWWHLSAPIVEEYVKILGFTETTLVYFRSGLTKGAAVDQWAIIAKKPAGLRTV
ncbi:hypothetical protein PY365_08040 [Roseiarcaceae bacterium H3SJ34-1]|uniref:hypothetical protein n=1 Tax=Terripilifer ovatus TaxID=3032367 RepID=UPI003AB94344|nr:hypothetical protein [Roseiarcaceae bacterium H3SJ34-1]